MAQTFTCPNCSAPLDYSGTDLTVRCPYCNSSVIVPDNLRTASGSGGVSTPASLPVVGMDALIGHATQLKEVARLIRSGNKIEAIKVYRQIFNVGLAEAKDAVEALGAGRPIVMPGSSGVVTTASSMSYNLPGYGVPTYGTPSAPTGGPDDEIGRLLRAGNKIEAIKVYRQAYGSGLKEAKDAVEAYERGFPLTKPANPMPVASTVGSSIPTYSATTTSGTFSNQSTKPTSFFAFIFWLTIACFPVAFVLTMMGLAFPNFARLAAPVLCPDRYIDSYGYVTSTEDSDGTSYNLVTVCVGPEGNETEPNGVLGGFITYGLFYASAFAIAFGFATLLRFKWIGCLPLMVALVVVPVAWVAYVGMIPSRTDANPFLILFGLDGSNNNPISQFIPATEGPAPTHTPEPSPTPSFAPRLLTIGGQEGQGDGQFDDTRALAVDGDGNMYAADYEGGRIQVFNSDGEFVTAYKIKGDNVYISGMAADNSDTLYVVYQGELHSFDGLTGEPRLDFHEIAPSNSWDDVAVTNSGDVVVASSDAIALFSPDGTQKMLVQDWGADLSSKGFPTVDVDNLAVDKDGNIYIASRAENQIYKFSSEGKFLDRMGEEGDDPGQFNNLFAVAIDSQNRIYALDYKGVQVFNARGGYLGLIEIEQLGFDITVRDEALYVMDRNSNVLLKYALPESR